MSGAEIMGNLYDLSPEGRELEPTPDRVDFGIVADREQMPDLRDLVESARVALDELDALVDA